MFNQNRISSWQNLHQLYLVFGPKTLVAKPLGFVPSQPRPKLDLFHPRATRILAEKCKEPNQGHFCHFLDFRGSESG